jgi:hypothetical protein
MGMLRQRVIHGSNPGQKASFWCDKSAFVISFCLFGVFDIFNQRPGGGDVGLLKMKWTNAPLVPRFYSQSEF